MSILGDALNRTRRRRPRSPFGDDASPAPQSSSQQTSGHAPPPDGRSELARRRDALAGQVTEMHWDLGGLAYEMAIRDHFRLDVLVARAAALQERDAELAEVERLLALEETASAGNCPTCGAPHSRGAVYCWQCGATLMHRSATPPSQARSSSTDDLAPTAPMDALLAAETGGDDGSARPLLPADG
jgi:uncharacterized Zn finger protein (UPF0148 family)